MRLAINQREKDGIRSSWHKEFTEEVDNEKHDRRRRTSMA